MQKVWLFCLVQCTSGMEAASEKQYKVQKKAKGEWSLR